MTIRLEKTSSATYYANLRGLRLEIQSTVVVDTEREELEAKRAFENVLAPRFTRDEAIAIAVTALRDLHAKGSQAWHPRGAARAVLEALAAAGVFVDGRNMADKLDAAGIR